MAGKLFDRFCLSMMLINDNVYTFISGILLSVSTGVVTTLCMEKTPLGESWHLYLSSLIYTVVGGMLIYITSQVSSYQSYIASKKIVNQLEKKEIIKDFEMHRWKFWVVYFLSMIALMIVGTVLLFLNYAF